MEGAGWVREKGSWPGFGRQLGFAYSDRVRGGSGGSARRGERHRTAET